MKSDMVPLEEWDKAVRGFTQATAQLTRARKRIKELKRELAEVQKCHNLLAKQLAEASDE